MFPVAYFWIVKDDLGKKVQVFVCFDESFVILYPSVAVPVVVFLLIPTPEIR
jgi:hypothetical protein